MKKVIGILAVVAFAANMASAELLKNAKYTGSIEVKSVTVNNYPGFDADNLVNNHSETMPRVMLGVNFDLNDEINAQITAVKCDNQYGNTGDMVIYFGPSSNLGSSYSVSALDAWFGEWKKDKWSATALIGKWQENSVVNMRDKDVYGVTAAYDFSEMMKPSLYVYQLDDRIASLTAAKTNVAGVKVTGKWQDLG